MERESSVSHNGNVKSLLEAIRSSEVVENQVQLLGKLGDLKLNDKSDLSSLVECLFILWEDFTCLDISQCVLNKTILQLAAKYVDSDLSECLVQFLTLGTKASTWCGKHLKVTVMSSKECQEDEHCDHFFQQLLDVLSMSASSMAALKRYPVLADDETMASIIRFVNEQLNLVKDVILESKGINSLGSEMLKTGQMVIDSVIGLCKDFHEAVDWDDCNANLRNDQDNIECKRSPMVDHFVSIANCVVHGLCELGVLAAKDGGRLVNILNVSWKGIVTVLQQVAGISKEMVCVQEVISRLISLVNEHVKCAAEAWSSSLMESVSIIEARRTFLPVKFYLVNMLKISSLHPCQAFLFHREIILCILVISTLQMLLSCDKFLYHASEVSLDLLENTTLDLLASVLNSPEVKQELRFELLDWLFLEEHIPAFTHLDSSTCYRLSLMVELLSGGCKDIPGARILLLGRVALFHTLLRCSVRLEEDVKTNISRKLGWLLNTLVDEELYSFILDMQIPVLCGSEKQFEIVWQPMFSALVDSLKTFMIVVPSGGAWVELEDFLLENLFHPHFLCWEIVTELLGFLVRHAENGMVIGILNKLCSLMKSIVSLESVLFDSSPLRKIARAVCWLLINCDTSIVDYTYVTFVEDGVSPHSPTLFLSLLGEGFPLDSLSDSMGSNAKQKLIKEYLSFIGGSDELLTITQSDALKIPIYALSASLQLRQVSISDIEMKTVKLLVAIIRNFSSNEANMEHQCHLLSQALWIFSCIKQLYECDQMEEVILELQNLCMSQPTNKDSPLNQCKPYLAYFMGGLGNMEILESDDCKKSSAVCELYHMLLRERHWALAHLALASFGSFAAHTSCNQLWRFVPENAALAYDVLSGNDVNEDRFMLELKGFLEKEKALHTIAPSLEQFDLLLKEGMILREVVQKISSMQVEINTMACEDMEVDVENLGNKRRKLPDGINQGMELLHSGLKIIGDGLSQWQQDQFCSSDVHSDFLSHFTCLEELVNRLIGLADYG